MTVRRRPTIIDIAREAAVSKTTVSRVLNGSPKVAPDTRIRVVEATRKLGFRINPAARSLRTRRSALVGLMVPMLREPFGLIAEGLDQSLAESGIGLVISCSRWDGRQDLATLERLVDRGVDAIVVSLADDRGEVISSHLRALRKPILLLDREVSGLSTDAVLTDHRPGIHEAVDHLVGVGRRTIGLVTMSERTRPGRELAAAFVEAWSDRCPDREPLVVQADNLDRELGAAAVGKLLDRGADALIVGPSVELAAGALDCLAERRLRLPEDVSLIGFDENELASAKAPRLTVISRDIDLCGHLAGELIVRRIRQPSSRIRIETLRTQLVAGSSTDPGRRRATPRPTALSSG